MKRRKLFALILVVALAATSLVGCGAGSATKEGDGTHSPTYKLRLSTLVNDDHFLTKSAKRFADSVYKATDGDIEITVYPSSQLGDYTSVYDELKMGTIDLAWQTMPDTYDRRADLGMTPYLAMNYDDIAKLYCNQDSWFFKELKEVNKEQGVTLLGIVPNGFMGIGAKKLGNLDTLFDVTKNQDALIRSAAVDTLIAQVKAFGFRTTTIPYADLYSALQTGVADGWYGGSLISNDVGFKDVISYFVEYKGTNEPMGMLMSTQVLEPLPAEYQDLLIRLANEENAKALEDVKTAEQDSRTDLENYGIKIITPTDEELQTLAKEVRAQVYPLFAKDFGEDLMNEINTWVEQLD